MCVGGTPFDELRAVACPAEEHFFRGCRKYGLAPEMHKLPCLGPGPAKTWSRVIGKYFAATSIAYENWN